MDADGSGTPNSNYVLTAVSGIDYSVPFGVPEPATLSITGAGVLLPSAAKRRRTGIRR